MNKITLGVAALATLLLAGLDTNRAQAAHGYSGFGFHYSGRNVHLDLGRPHGQTYRYQRQGTYRVARAYPAHYGVRGHFDWHNTSHYDYHPGQYVRHGNHLDYQPAHYDWHPEGHYDFHRGRHR